MTDRYSTQRIMAWVGLPMLVLAISIWLGNSKGLHLAGAALADDMSQAEFEKRVHDYLLEHPEVVGEAINRLEAKQAELDAVAATAAVKSHADEIFQDPDSPVSGNPKGDVTLVEFFDYNCPYCRSMAPLLTQAEGADPQLRIVYKEFPILGAGSVFAAKAALAANKQGKYVAFHRALYQVRGPVDEAKVLEVAKAVGLDVNRMKADMQDKAIEAALDKNNKLGQVLHITGTPGWVAGDQVSTGATEFDGLKAMIARVRNGHQEAK